MHNTEKPLVNNKLLTIYRFDIKNVRIQGRSIQFFKKNGNLRFRSVFLENYYLFEDKEYFCYVKQHLKSSNSFTKVAQLPLLWQQ